MKGSRQGQGDCMAAQADKTLLQRLCGTSSSAPCCLQAVSLPQLCWCALQQDAPGQQASLPVRWQAPTGRLPAQQAVCRLPPNRKFVNIASYCSGNSSAISNPWQAEYA